MGLFDRLRGRISAPSAPSTATTSEETPAPVTLTPEELAHAESSLREAARVEFVTATDAFEDYDGLATDHASEGLPLDRARAILRQEWDERERLAREHVGEDHSSAVRRAFAALRAEGVLALESCGYDNSEGHDLAAEEARAAGAVGYVFFHAQDAARIVDAPGTLCLRFAPAAYVSTKAAGKYEEDEAIGRRVVAALEGQGLSVTWDGTGASVIALEGLRWYASPGPRGT